MTQADQISTLHHDELGSQVTHAQKKLMGSGDCADVARKYRKQSRRSLRLSLFSVSGYGLCAFVTQTSAVPCAGPDWLHGLVLAAFAAAACLSIAPC